MNQKEREVLKSLAFSYGSGVRNMYIGLIKNYGQKIGDNYLRLTTKSHTQRRPRKKLPIYKIGGSK